MHEIKTYKNFRRYGPLINELEVKSYLTKPEVPIILIDCGYKGVDEFNRTKCFLIKAERGFTFCL